MSQEVPNSENILVGDSMKSALDAIEMYYQKGWTDGLPVVPPTQEKVREMVEFSGRDGEEVLGIVPPREGIATIEKIAINAVMAGCLPAYFPVVLAAVEAMLEPKYNLHWVQLSTGGMCPLTIVTGPLTRELGINSGTNLFGSGFRANATIGRAIRLVLWNIGGAVPDIGRKAVLGHPSEYSHCIAERDDTPWEPLHVERGFAPQDSCVTVVTTTSYQRTDSFLSRMAAKMAAFSGFMAVGQMLYVAVLAPQVAWILARQGWSKQDVRQYLWDTARVPMSEIMSRGGSIRGVGCQDDDTFTARGLSLEGRWPNWVDTTNPETRVPVTSNPEDIIVVVAGGMAFGWCACLEAIKHSSPVTKRISWKGRADTPEKSLEASRMQIRSRLERYSTGSSYQFNPDSEMVSSIIEGLAHNELKHGFAYCTCRVPTGVPSEDRRIVCPCEDLTRELTEYGHCECGLFVTRENK